LKIFSFYLPQFHPDKMNDLFWGKNFTDWKTTKRAKPLFANHAQPFLPSDLGFYDLTNQETILKQAKLAKKHGVDGFGIYYYQFDEKTKALNTPIETIRDNRNIDIEYFICWVNADWTKSWVGDHETVLYRQSNTVETYEALASNACSHFTDERYFRVNNKPVFYIHDPRALDLEEFKKVFLRISSQNGFKEVLFAAPSIYCLGNQVEMFDYLLGYPPGDLKILPFMIQKRLVWLLERLKFLELFYAKPKLFNLFSTYPFERYVLRYLKYLSAKLKSKNYIPVILSGWDNTPRYGYRGFLFTGFSGSRFKELFSFTWRESKKADKDFLMIKAWNEWAEGNVLEPSYHHKNSVLEAIRDVRSEDSSSNLDRQLVG
jgi:hypothetical protein